MRRIPKPRPAALLLLAAFGVAAPSARAQEAPPTAETAAQMKPYVQDIAGSKLKFEMVPIPGGTFVLGSGEDEEDRKEDEGPTVKVEIAPFWMGAKEVTWDEFDEYCFSQDIKRKERAGVDLANQSEAEKKADASTRPTKPYADMTFGLGHDGNPAICMTHHSAMEYCRWLSAKTGFNYRLPTEAEWEYACRAGSTTPYNFGKDKDKLGDYAWYVENAQGPQKGGQKKPNAWGLYDMHGNVAEWCLDFYKPDAYAEFAKMGDLATRPVILPTAKEYPYVARGGSWDDDAEDLRSASRKVSNREWSVQDPQRPQSIWWHTDATFVGFRVVRPLVEQENLLGFRSPVVKGKGTR
ncbi:formylglycine-generating enzyme family protein [Tundrisphaera sp. TA3]|uniref:formylglycine-generating enzyme family protein n=1 Tax=Tundrisphaera sp. TA3 TaxID=3435775 RepID=UPI003EB82397